MSLARKLTATALLTGAAFLAACSDTAPTAAAPSLASGTGSAGAGTLSFVVYPGSPATFNLGDHKITFDKNAICDPARSTYGASEWDKPCTVAAGGVRITANWWTDLNGHPQIDFQPAMRFNPASNVTLTLMDKDASASASPNILWVAPNGSKVNEAALDASVATQIGSNGYLSRRVKHFSGYIVTTRSEAGYTDGAFMKGLPIVPEILGEAGTVARKNPLAQDLTVSKVIGKNGGTIEIPSAGLKLVVPSGAVAGDLTFSATAVAGSQVAYVFQPHGIVFARPLRLEQDLKALEVSALTDLTQVQAAYFADPAQLDATTGTVTANEFLPLSIDLSGSKLKLEVPHFSGYVIATGRR